MAVIYLNKTAVINLNETPNLLELENPRGVRFLYPEIFKRFSKIVREAVNRPIRPKVNKESRVRLKGRQTASRPLPAPPRQKLKGFKLIIELIRDNEKAVTIKAEALRKKARVK